MKTKRLTDEERLAKATRVVADALEAMRNGDTPEASQLFGHAVHDGVQAAELAYEIILQTGGSL